MCGLFCEHEHHMFGEYENQKVNVCIAVTAHGTTYAHASVSVCSCVRSSVLIFVPRCIGMVITQH